MFSKLNIFFSKDLQKDLQQLYLSAADGLLPALSLVTIIMGRDYKKIHQLNEKNNTEINRALYFEASRVELYLDFAEKGKRELYVFLSIFRKGRQEKPFLRVRFSTGGNELWYIGPMERNY